MSMDEKCSRNSETLKFLRSPNSQKCSETEIKRFARLDFRVWGPGDWWGGNWRANFSPLEA